jgi:hypothetical protein
MGMKRVITYDNRKIEINEPTISVWKLLYTTKDVVDETEIQLNLIKASTGLTDDELKEVEYHEIHSVASSLMMFYNNLDTKFYETFEFKGKKYRFADLPRMSFGQYVDLDSFGKGSELERIDGLNKYMSMLYIGEGDDPNDLDLRKERAEVFNELPIKYYLGAHGFFLSLGQILQGNTTDYLILKVKGWLMKTMKKINRSIHFGDGIQRFLSWLKTILPKLTKSRNNL